MQIALRRPFGRVTLTRQFLLASAGILVIGMALIGTWLGRQIETSAINRAAAIAAVYVESIVAAQITGTVLDGRVAGSSREVLDRLFVQGPLARKVVRVKLWDHEGRILYSSDPTQTGDRYPLHGHLAAAFGGEVQAKISTLGDPDNLPERERWSELLEVYVPVHAADDDTVVAVAEFYHSMRNLRSDIRGAQWRSWLVVAVATGAMFLVLLGWVRRASNTIIDQQRDLRRQLNRLRTTLAENDRMRVRLREAGAHTTALNEQFLHRVAADLHDGPAQDTALALLRLEALAESCPSCTCPSRETCPEFSAVDDALHTALDEIRAIAAGLRIPGIAALSLAGTIERAVRDFERKTGACVDLLLGHGLGEVDGPIAVKITAYRLIQEALTNGLRHSQGGRQQVKADVTDDQLHLDVIDHGSGFDPDAPGQSDRLGLSFMRERVTLVGGNFELHAAPGQGTRIVASLPLTLEGTTNA